MRQSKGHETARAVGTVAPSLGTGWESLILGPDFIHQSRESSRMAKCMHIRLDRIQVTRPNLTFTKGDIGGQGGHFRTVLKILVVIKVIVLLY